MGLIVATGKYEPYYQIALSSVSTGIMAPGDLITNNKELIGNCLNQEGGGAILQEFQFVQIKEGVATLQKQDTDLYVFNNSDTLVGLSSNDPFVYDANTTAINVVFHHKFAAADWIDTPTLNPISSYLELKDINKLIWTSEADTQSRDLYFILVTGGTPTFDDHTLTCNFGIEYTKIRQ